MEMQTELLDRFTQRQEADPIYDLRPRMESNAIGFRNATFSWGSERSSLFGSEGAVTPSRRTFRLRIEGDLFFKRGKLSLIIGTTGSGTSPINATYHHPHFSQLV